MWESVLIGAGALVVGALATLSTFSGRLARLEAKSEENDREHKSFSVTLANIEQSQRDTFRLLYAVAIKTGTDVPK